MMEVLDTLHTYRWVGGTYFFLVATVVLLWAERVRRVQAEYYRQAYEQQVRLNSYLEHLLVHQGGEQRGQENDTPDRYLRYEGGPENRGPALFKRRKVRVGNGAFDRGL